MENACRRAALRLSCVAALILAGPIAAVEPAAGPADPPEPALLQFLGETSGLDPELMRFMESREARRAVKDAAKKGAETADPQVAADLQPSGEERLRTEGAARWETMSDTERAAARARFNTWRRLPAEEREAVRERWKRFRELTPGQQAAVREAYREFLELPPERREEMRERWREMSPEERRRALQRRQGPKPGSEDKRPCPPC